MEGEPVDVSDVELETDEVTLDVEDGYTDTVVVAVTLLLGGRVDVTLAVRLTAAVEVKLEDTVPDTEDTADAVKELVPVCEPVPDTLTVPDRVTGALTDCVLVWLAVD